jgi:hypothetical protein
MSLPAVTLLTQLYTQKQDLWLLENIRNLEA